MLYLPRDLPKDVVSRFAAQAAPPIDTLSDGEIHGWVTGRHLLDRNITPDTAFLGGFLRLSLMHAERKIPEALLRAECRMEELARMQAENLPRLSQTVRREIRESITKRLLPKMPPTLKGLSMVADPAARLVYTTALSDKQLDAFQVNFSMAAGFGGVPVLPETAAVMRRNVSIKDWPATSFSPEVDDPDVSNDPGLDFFTWLWFAAESRGGMFTLGNLGSWAAMVEGPLTLVREGAGAHEAVVRRGEPLVSAETKAALMDGKKLRRAKLTLARMEETWSCTFDAPTFTVRGLKLPEGEKLDLVSKFQERMQYLDVFKEAVLSLFDRFVDERNKPATWEKTRAEIHAWVSKRKTRA